MKKFKLLLIILISFVFITNVDALLSDDKCITIKELTSETWDAKFDAILPVCTYDYSKPTDWLVVSGISHEKPTAQKAWEQGEKEYTEIHYWSASADNKSWLETSATVPICTSEKRMVQVTGTCTALKSSVEKEVTKSAFNCENITDKDTCTAYGNSPGKCYWFVAQGVGACHGGQISAAQYDCPSGTHVDSGAPSGRPCCADGYVYGSYPTFGIGCLKTIQDNTYKYDYYNADDKAHRADADHDYAKKVLETKVKGEEGTTNVRCETSTFKYQLLCPYYACKEENIQVHACVPTFEAPGGAEAYCINPSLGFPKGVTNNYEPTSFDVNDCQDSFTNKNCGYANILIEGAYWKEKYGVTDQAMYLALRLWARHNKEAGFDSTGIANLVSDGGTCNKFMVFRRNSSSYGNVYVGAYNEISSVTANYIANARSNSDIASDFEKLIGSQGASIFHNVQCSAPGVACEWDSTVYKHALALFLNTLVGNKYMFTHLHSLYSSSSEGIIAKPTAATVIEDDSFDVVYNGKTYSCKTYTKDTTLSKDDKAAIKELCDKKWILVSYSEEFDNIFGEQTEIDCKTLDTNPAFTDEEKAMIRNYCKTTIEIIGPDGKPIEDGLDPEVICIKGKGCQYKTKITAICSKDTKKTTIRRILVHYTNDESSYSVRKYIPCGTIDGQQRDQYMFVYYKDTGEGNQKRKEVATYEVTGYNCGDDGCKDYSLKGNYHLNTCALDEGDSYVREVKDPSLKCIVNMALRNEKEKYDYSTELGVKNSFCRIYCSDSVTYVMQGTINGISGRPFIYDLRSTTGSFFGHNVNPNVKLSAVVKEKRSCVSEIYYNKQLPNDATYWKTIYGLDSLPTIDDEHPLTWSRLFEYIAKELRDKDLTENRKEVLNKMVYELYNCNLYTSDASTSGTGVYDPKDEKSNQIINDIVRVFGKDNNYNIEKVAGNDFSNFTDTISYEFGSKIATYNEAQGTSPSSETLTGGVVGVNPNYIKAAKVKNNVDNKPIVTDAEDIKVKYCSGDCMKYDPANEEANYTYNVSGSSSTKNAYGYKIPTNDYAFFEVTAEVDFYNNNTYQSINNTGHVVLPKSDGSTYASLLTLDKYSYPTDKYAKNNSSCVGGVCPVTQTFTVGTFNRKVGNNNDAFKEAVESNKAFTCYINMRETVTTCVEGFTECGKYRNVNPSAIFPDLNNIGANWKSYEGVRAQQQIQNTSSLLTTSDKLLEYKITLTPEQIKSVKSYNKQKGAYINEVTNNCEKYIIDKEGKLVETKEDGEGVIYLNCKSEFLNLLRNSDGSSSVYGTIDPNYMYGTSYCASNEHQLECYGE